MKKLFILFAACVMAAMSYGLEPIQVGTLVGTIGPYKIHMVIDKRKINKGYIGYYYYDNHPNNHFRLRATKWEDACGGCAWMGYDVVLQEYTSSGKNSGEFVLYYTEYEHPSKGERDEDIPGCVMNRGWMDDFCEGTFRNKSNGKKYKVRLDMITE